VNDEDYHRETETRQQIIRIFLVISSFFAIFSEGDVRKAIGIIFPQFLIFAIIYYIILTRTRNTFFINLFGILSSYSFSLLFTIFIGVQLEETISALNLLAVFLLLIVLVTFALLAPSTSERLVHRVKTTAQELTPLQKKMMKWAIRALVLVFLLFTFFIGYETITI
jgi:hypothetical protein